MAVPEELLDRLRSLEGPLAGVRSAVNDALSANHDPEMLVTVREAIAAVEAATEQWLAESERIEAALLGYWRQRDEDRNDVQARLGGLAMLHLGVAEDVAVLVALDRAPEGTPMSNVQAELPDGASIIDEVAFGEGRLLRSLGEPLDVGPEPDPFPGEAVEDLVKRAGRATTAVVLGLAPPPTVVIESIGAVLRDGLNLAPADVHPVLTAMTGKVARLVVRLVHRARHVISSVLGNYLPFVTEIIETADPASFVAESISGSVFGQVLHARDVLDRAEAAFAQRPDKNKVGGRLGKLVKSHQKWVGPVRAVARGIKHLWAVPIGPVPAAPVAAITLLGWTVVLTGDMLDTKHYPDLWKGVVRVSQGES